jgi:hypothetical protein
MLGISSAIAFIISVILIAVDKTGTGLANPLLWIGVGGALLALHVTVPVNWGPVRRV